MSLYKRVYEDLKDKKERREEGKYNSIYFPDLPKLNKVIPGIQKGKFIMCTASPKVGKTQLTDFMFVYQPLKFLYTNPDSNINIKIFYNSLEISKEAKHRQLIAYLLSNSNIYVSPEQMQSVFEDYVLPDSVLYEIEKFEPYFEWFYSKVEFIDNIRNSFGIYNHVRNYMEATGKYYKKSGEVIPIDLMKQNRSEYGIQVDRYEQNNKDEYVIVITDHISLLTPQRDEGSVHAAINNFSNDYCLSMRDRYNCTVVNVHQQVATKEELKFDSSGKTMVDSLRPSVDGLADSKYDSKDVNLMLGLFAPVRYKLKQYNGYDITKLGDNYRELMIILNRDGGGFINLDLGFNGACSKFWELPPPNKI